MGSSDPEVIVDQVSNLFAAKETVLLLGFLFLQTDSSFERKVWKKSNRTKRKRRRVKRTTATQRTSAHAWMG